MHRPLTPHLARIAAISCALIAGGLGGLLGTASPTVAKSVPVRAHAHHRRTAPAMVGRLVLRQGSVLHLIEPSGKPETVHLAPGAHLRPFHKERIVLKPHDYVALWIGKKGAITRGRFGTDPIGQAHVSLRGALTARRGTILTVTTTGKHPVRLPVWLVPATRIVLGAARTSAQALRPGDHVTIRGARYGSAVVASFVRIARQTHRAAKRHGT